jgi:hypothetical protein
MDEQAFETFLASAYSAPSDRPEQPELARAVVDRVQRRRRARAAVLALAAAVGVGVAAAAIAATGVARALGELVAHAPPEPAMLDPSIVVAGGLFLMLLAAARNMLREL